MEFRTQRFELVEIQIGASTGRTQFTFPDLPNLTGRNGEPVIIDSIVIYGDFNIPTSPISQLDVVNDNVLKNSFLTIYQGDLQVLNQIPLVQLNFIGTPASTTVPSSINQSILKDLINVSWTKSFIQTIPGIISANTVFLLGIHYTVLSQTKGFDNMVRQVYSQS